MSNSVFASDPLMTDADGVEEITYKWEKEFQRHIAALLISDRQFLLQSLDLVRPSYFTDKAHNKVVSIVFDHFQKYRLIPKKEFITQELRTEFKDHKALPYYLTEVNVLFDYFQPGMENREYLQDKVSYFAKIMSLKKAFHDSLKMIDKAPESEETWDKIYDKMREAMTTHQNLEIGIDYFHKVKDRYDETTEDKEKDLFYTGLPTVDNSVTAGGYGRGELFAVVAHSGVGKSLELANIAATNLLRGKKGIYITLELAEKKVAQRMDAILTGFPIQNLCANKDEIFEKLSTMDGIVRDNKEVGALVIKYFSPGTCSVNTIRAFISQLRFHGFDPDFLAVDYVGEMQAYADMKTYESREKSLRELRGLLNEENIFGTTAMQPNRESKETKGSATSRLDEHNLADSFGQIRIVDGCLSLMQNDNEKFLGIGRGYQMKQRDGLSRFEIYLRFNKENLRITEITKGEYLTALNAHKEYVTEETKIDMIVDKGWKPSEEKDD